MEKENLQSKTGEKNLKTHLLVLEERDIIFLYWKKKYVGKKSSILEKNQSNWSQLCWKDSERLGIHSNWDITTLTLSSHNEGNKQPNSLLFPDIITIANKWLLNETS